MMAAQQKTLIQQFEGIAMNNFSRQATPAHAPQPIQQPSASLDVDLRLKHYRCLVEELYKANQKAIDPLYNSIKQEVQQARDSNQFLLELKLEPDRTLSITKEITVCKISLSPSFGGHLEVRYMWYSGKNQEQWRRDEYIVKKILLKNITKETIRRWLYWVREAPQAQPDSLIMPGEEVYRSPKKPGSSGADDWLGMLLIGAAIIGVIILYNLLVR